MGEQRHWSLRCSACMGWHVCQSTGRLAQQSRTGKSIIMMAHVAPAAPRFGIIAEYDRDVARRTPFGRSRYPHCQTTWRSSVVALGQRAVVARHDATPRLFPGPVPYPYGYAQGVQGWRLSSGPCLGRLRDTCRAKTATSPPRATVCAVWHLELWSTMRVAVDGEASASPTGRSRRRPGGAPNN